LGLEYYRLEEDIATSTSDKWTLNDYIEPDSFELYNHKDTPKQDHNIISNHPDATKELHQFLIWYMQAIS
jgi:hypothetical protein